MKPNPIPQGISRRAFLKRSAQAGLAAGLVGTGCLQSPALRLDKPNILLITLATTRRDALSCYGHPLGTTPNLDKVAEDSVLYMNAYSTAGWTLPAHASLFTGKFVYSHGARFDPEGPLRLAQGVPGDPDWGSLHHARGLAKDEVTLAETLAMKGYTTMGAVAGPWMKRVFGLSKGFQHYDDGGDFMLSRDARDVTRIALDMLEQPRDKPYFLFLNYFDPHQPYRPPDKNMKTLMSRWKAGAKSGESPKQTYMMYHAEVNFMDEMLGRLFDGLKKLDLYDSTWIIVTNDHGEMLGEHDIWGHSTSMNEEIIRSPLFMKFPRGDVAPQTSNKAVQLLDIPPMIFKRLNLPVPRDMHGVVPGEGKHPIMTELYPYSSEENLILIRTIMRGNHKLITSEGKAPRLYDIRSDPGELTDLRDRRLELADAMEAELDAHIASLPLPGPAGEGRALTEEEIEGLRSSGYLE